MHQALTETFAYQRTSNGYLQVCRLNAGSPYTVHELSRATITISTDGYLTDVKDIIEIDNLEKGAVYSKRKQRAKRRGEYGISEGVAVIARTKPIMTPIMPRLLYTPNDTSFLNATLSISSGGHELTSTVSPHHFQSKKQNNSPYTFQTHPKQPTLTKSKTKHRSSNASPTSSTTQFQIPSYQPSSPPHHQTTLSTTSSPSSPPPQQKPNPPRSQRVYSTMKH